MTITPSLCAFHCVDIYNASIGFKSLLLLSLKLVQHSVTVVTCHPVSLTHGPGVEESWSLPAQSLYFITRYCEGGPQVNDNSQRTSDLWIIYCKSLNASYMHLLTPSTDDLKHIVKLTCNPAKGGLASGWTHRTSVVLVAASLLANAAAFYCSTPGWTQHGSLPRHLASQSPCGLTSLALSCTIAHANTILKTSPAVVQKQCRRQASLGPCMMSHAWCVSRHDVSSSLCFGG